jgi:hypothetical protein
MASGVGPEPFFAILNSMKTLALVSALVAAVATIATPIVQVRDVPTMPYVSIVAWQPGEAHFGLRTRLRRDGSHLGENRVGEHRLFLNSVYVESNGGYNHAVAHSGKLLRNIAGTISDAEACRYGACSPAKTLGIGVSDEFLRQHRDSLIVTMRPKVGRNWVIRLDSALINAYLTTVDSLAATMKK